MVKKLPVIILLVQFTFVKQGQAADEVYCKAPPASKGDPATITCHFQHDIQAKRENVLVQRLPPDAASVKVDPINVLNCTWTSTGDFPCKAGNGYSLLGDVRKTAVILIPRAIGWYEGRYTCAPKATSVACVFQLSDLSTTEGPSTKTDFSEPGETSDSEDSDDTTEPQYLLLMVLMFAVLILIAIITTLLVKKWRLRCSLTSRRPGGPSAVPLTGERNDTGGGAQDTKCCFGLFFRSNSKEVHYQNTSEILEIVGTVKEGLVGIKADVGNIKTVTHNTDTNVAQLQESVEMTTQNVAQFQIQADKTEETMKKLCELVFEIDKDVKKIKNKVKNIENKKNRLDDS